MKPILSNLGLSPAASHMVAASLGEVSACLVRVPTEVVKAKMQTCATTSDAGVLATIRTVLGEQHGSPLASVTGGLYRGYGMTLFREIPFAAIQFPLYERFKAEWAAAQSRTEPLAWQAAACGSLSGAIAGALTTPLDVLKTRTQVG